ncbi:hypothetical protein HYV11_04065 [Candidatus Dependentiae bacterium]|nr:hypothetical protein [Candidatus Dependentiae bacterium]
MIKKMKKGLGTIPKGLQWITIEPENQLPEIKQSIDSIIPAAKRGLQHHLIRATFILRQEYLEKIKSYAYWERLQIKDVFDEMCEQFFKNKKIRSIPEKKQIK